ncbi:caspase family protein [Apiospora arundinis]|uniref:Caspase family protein n=1 Tax=Apiospora arundinis TaxID=335852 RepID=A0ABR2ISM0_9PEZI
MGSNENPYRWAIIIGIDHYSNGNNLWGCANDALLVSSFLRKKLAVPRDNIFLHIAQNVNDGMTEPLETGGVQTIRATPNAVWDSFMTVAKKVEKEEHKAFLHVHFSGHGDRQPTMFSEELKASNIKRRLSWLNKINQHKTLRARIPPVFKDCKKPPDATDELLCFPSGDSITDVEFAMMLSGMSSKGLSISVTLDSCFSGGMSRNVDDDAINIRCMSHARNRSQASYGNPSQTVKESTFTPVPIPTTSRNLHRRDSLLSHEHENVNLLMACQANQEAAEGKIQGYNPPKSYGIFTDTLIDRLNMVGDLSQTTYWELQGILDVVCHGERRLRQVPAFVGKDSRLLFDNKNGIKDSPEQAFIKRVNSGNTITIGKGRATGARLGDKYRLVRKYIEGTSDDPLFEVTRIHELESECTVSGTIKKQSELDNLFHDNKVVQLFKSAPVLVRWTDTKRSRHSADAIRHKLDSRFLDEFSLVSCEDKSRPGIEAELGVHVYEDRIEIRNEDNKPFEFLPAILISGDYTDTVANLELALRGMNKYQRFLALTTPNMADKPFEFKLERIPVVNTTVTDMSGKPHFIGSSYRYSFKNNSLTMPLFFTVFGISPGYGIEILYPKPEVYPKGCYVEPDATEGGSQSMEVDLSVPEWCMNQYKVNRLHKEIVRVVVTTEAADLRGFCQNDVLREALSRGFLTRDNVRTASWWVQDHRFDTPGAPLDEAFNPRPFITGPITHPLAVGTRVNYAMENGQTQRFVVGPSPRRGEGFYRLNYDDAESNEVRGPDGNPMEVRKEDLRVV